MARPTVIQESIDATHAFLDHLQICTVGLRSTCPECERRIAQMWEAREHLAMPCPIELESATGYFDPSGYDAGICAGCGSFKSEHCEA